MVRLTFFAAVTAFVVSAGGSADEPRLVPVPNPMLPSSSATAGKDSARVVQPSPADAESLIRKARVADANARDREKEIACLLVEIDTHIREIQPGVIDLGKEKITLEKFKLVLPRLKQEAKWLLDRKGEFDANGSAYRDALDQAGQALVGLVPVWDRFAKDEPEQSLREKYASTGKHFQVLSTEMSRRSKDFQRESQTIQEKMLFVERSFVFLERLERVVPILEGPAARGAEVQAYLDGLRNYIAQFEAAIKSFHSLSEKMRGPGDAAPGDNPGAKPRVVQPDGGTGRSNQPRESERSQKTAELVRVVPGPLSNERFR
jgi:hypothetical protein